MKKTVFVALLAGLVLSTATVFAADCNCKPLFGKNLENADYDAAVWSVDENGELFAVRDSVIWTKEKFGDCKISFEYKLSTHANAGLLIQCSDRNNWIPNTIEVQLLDDFGTEANYHGNGSFYGYQAPTKVVTKPAGEWNKMVVTIKGRTIVVEVNGEKINEIDTAQWTDAKKSPAGTDIEGKFQGKSLAEADPVGYIGLQGLHGQSPVQYRNLTIE